MTTTIDETKMMTDDVKDNNDDETTMMVKTDNDNDDDESGSACAALGLAVEFAKYLWSRDTTTKNKQSRRSA